MTFAYARTREREKAWKFGGYCLLAALILAAPVCKLFQNGPLVGVTDEDIPKLMYRHDFTFVEVCL
jgi:hypothetical protein